MPYRAYVVASSLDELAARTREVTALRAPANRKVGFMLTGQGSQYVGMGRAIYEHVPSFRSIMSKCSEAFYPYLGAQIIDLLYGPEADEHILVRTDITQCVVFALDFALGSYLLQIGIQPAFLIGHSIGEWAAACLAGVVDLSTAARLVAARGRLMADLQSSGAMAAVFAPLTSLEELLGSFGGRLHIAAYNISHVVVSGTNDDLSLFLGFLHGKGVITKRLRVSQAFHTPLMEPMVKQFISEMEGVSFLPPRIPIISCVTGELLDQAPDASHWAQHIMYPVKFEQGINFMLKRGVDIFCEVGPDKILSGMLNPLPNRERIRTYSFCQRFGDGLEVFLEGLGRIFTAGLKIDWKTFEEDFGHKKVLLPTYPFARNEYKPDFGTTTAAHSPRREVVPVPGATGGDGQDHRRDIVSLFSPTIHEEVPFKQHTDVRGLIYEIISQLVGVRPDDLDVASNFLEIGLNSVGAAKVIYEAGKRLNMDLSPTLILQYQTPEALAGYLETACAMHVSS